MKALSTRNDQPEKASRPFDKDRDGFVMGEGSAILILEELGFARKRGARIYAELLGYGASADAHHVTAPAPGGERSVRAMAAALADGGVDAGAVEYVNAHGPPTPLNDPNEIRAIKKVFGPQATGLNVSSTKSSTGHMLGTAGAVEALFTALTIKHGIIPPTINLTTPDPECDLDCTANVPVKRDVVAALSNSSGFGGHNVSIHRGRQARHVQRSRWG